jgi:hypothetical protein
MSCCGLLLPCVQNLYNCGPNKVPLPGELQAVEVVQRIKVRASALWSIMSVLPYTTVHLYSLDAIA